MRTFFGVIILLMIVGSFMRDDKHNAGSNNQAFSGDLQDASALDEKYGTDGALKCGYGADDYLRSIAKYDFGWDDAAKGFLGVKFGSRLTHVDQPGVLTFVSDRSKLQNGFGGWTHIELLCRYDTQRAQVLGYSSNQ